VEFKTTDPCKTTSGLTPRKNADGVAENIALEYTIGSAWHIDQVIDTHGVTFPTTATFGTLDKNNGKCKFSYSMVTKTNARGNTQDARTYSTYDAATGLITFTKGMPTTVENQYNYVTTLTNEQGEVLTGAGYQSTVKINVVSACTIPVTTVPTDEQLAPSYNYKVDEDAITITLLPFTVLPSQCDPTYHADYSGSFKRITPAALTTEQLALETIPVAIQTA
jgi:hypothetical protein